MKKEKLASFGECFNYKQIYLGWISSEKIYVTVEQFIPGQFVTYVNNTGNIIPVNDVNSTRGQKAECLVHFSYIKSHKKLMLVDIQGSSLYDPEIASTDLMVDQEILLCGKLVCNSYVFNSYVYNQYCEMLKLKPVSE